MMDWTEERYALDVLLAGGTRQTCPKWTLGGLVGCEVFILDVRENIASGYGSAFALVYDRGFTVHPTLESAMVSGEVVAPGVQLRELERRIAAETEARDAAREAALAWQRLTGEPVAA